MRPIFGDHGLKQSDPHGQISRDGAGSTQAGPKVAAILSVVESCRRLKLPVRDYLAAVLPGLSDLPIRRLPDITSSAWVKTVS